jgi:cyclohexyl-isocyanide hydratase
MTDTNQPGTHLCIGSLLFPGLDQIDLAGPFEVLSRLSHCTYNLIAKEKVPPNVSNALRILPDFAGSDL